MADRRQRLLLLMLLVLGLNPVDAVERGSSNTRIRAHDARVRKVLSQGLARSPSFRELVATLETLDRSIELEHRSSPARSNSGCSHGVPVAVTPTTLLVRFDASEPTQAGIRRAAHALYHALEIAREPDVVDEPGRRELFARIGAGCSDSADACCETRAAAAFEVLVMRELAGQEPAE